jgi:hypothetical protein
MSAFKAGGAYFASVFAAGFALGAVRVFLIEPRLGPLGAVLLETPFMLAASWFLCSLWIRRFKVAATTGARLVMGAFAFSLLIAAETLLGRYGFGRSFAEMLAAYGTAPGAAGLAAQILFALFPVVQRVSASSFKRPPPRRRRR